MRCHDDCGEREQNNSVDALVRGSAASAPEGIENGSEPPDAEQANDADRNDGDVALGEELGRQDDRPTPQRVGQQEDHDDGRDSEDGGESTISQV
jgi:hypothetical protein